MSPKLDDVDQKLLTMLREDSRSPLKSLAGEVGLSVSSVQERVQRLLRDGVITKYTIEMGDDVSQLAYMLVTTNAQQCATVAPKIAHIEEIVRCDSVAGDVDMVLQVAVFQAARLQEIRDEIAAIDGVVEVKTLPRMVERFAR